MHYIIQDSNEEQVPVDYTSGLITDNVDYQFVPSLGL